LSGFHEVSWNHDSTIKGSFPLLLRNSIEVLRVLPEEVFYTDDREELVKSAKALKINSFVFKDIKKLKSDLAGLGVVSN
ncbi:MAG: hypothetical protein JXL82_04275, partial [Candidatus Omnitrophica bacterium]|nr:hypothetical protein [Candidatus Omnitrophota bacterium]